MKLKKINEDDVHLALWVIVLVIILTIAAMAGPVIVLAAVGLFTALIFGPGIIVKLWNKTADWLDR